MILGKIFRKLMAPLSWLVSKFYNRRSKVKFNNIREFNMSRTSDTYRYIIENIKNELQVTILTGIRSGQFKISESEFDRLNSVISSVIDTQGANGFEKISNSFNKDVDDVKKAEKKTKKK